MAALMLPLPAVATVEEETNMYGPTQSQVPLMTTYLLLVKKIWIHASRHITSNRQQKGDRENVKREEVIGTWTSAKIAANFEFD